MCIVSVRSGRVSCSQTETALWLRCILDHAAPELPPADNQRTDHRRHTNHQTILTAVTQSVAALPAAKTAVTVMERNSC